MFGGSVFKELPIKNDVKTFLPKYHITQHKRSCSVKTVGWFWSPTGITNVGENLYVELSIISKVFSLAVKNDFLEFNPCSRVEKSKFDNIQNRILRMEDEAKFFAEFQSDWAKDICILVLNTGLRQNDALGLSKFNIDWSIDVIRLIQGKTKRVVEIPMNNTVKTLLQARRHNGSDLLFPSPKN